MLANEEVIDGLSERGNHPVIRKPMKQWMLKITRIADRLLEDLDELDWPDSIKEMQRNWIGKSEGARSPSPSTDSPRMPRNWRCTRRVRTRSSALAVLGRRPSRDDRRRLLRRKRQKDAVSEYVLAASRKSDLERTELSKEKTGVFTGSYAVHPLTGEKLPIWVAITSWVPTDGVHHGGASAFDERDYEFAQTFDLPIVEVVEKPKGAEGVYSGGGKMMNSACDAINVDGLNNVDALAKIVEDVGQREVSGTRRPITSSRDWLFARQRYWGEPFPVVSPRTTRTRRFRFPNPNFRLCCRRRTTSSRAAAKKDRSQIATIGCARLIRARVNPRFARRTRCHSGLGRAGTTCDS